MQPVSIPTPSPLSKRLNAHFVTVGTVGALAAGLGAVAPQADANIIWSGPVNITVPSNSDGVYLNIMTGAQDSSSVPGTDVSVYGSDGLHFYNFFDGALSGGVYVTNGVSPEFPTLNLISGTLISSGSPYGVGTHTLSTGFNLNSSANLVGFRFLDDLDNQVHYGWMRLSLSSTLISQPRAIVEYAYEDQTGVGIAAGATSVPVPASAALLALGAAGLSSRRRKA